LTYNSEAPRNGLSDVARALHRQARVNIDKFIKHKTDEQINPVNGLEPGDQSDRQKQTKVKDKIF